MSEQRRPHRGFNRSKTAESTATTTTTTPTAAPITTAPLSPLHAGGDVFVASADLNNGTNPARSNRSQTNMHPQVQSNKPFGPNPTTMRGKTSNNTKRQNERNSPADGDENNKNKPSRSENQRNVKICRFFNTAQGCKFGENCPLLHKGQTKKIPATLITGETVPASHQTGQNNTAGTPITLGHAGRLRKTADATIQSGLAQTDSALTSLINRQNRAPKQRIDAPIVITTSDGTKIDFIINNDEESDNDNIDQYFESSELDDSDLSDADNKKADLDSVLSVLTKKYHTSSQFTRPSDNEHEDDGNEEDDEDNDNQDEDDRDEQCAGSVSKLDSTSARFTNILSELISGNYHCLICMDTITEHTYVWNCHHCNLLLHYDCIKAIALPDLDGNEKQQKLIAAHKLKMKSGVEYDNDITNMMNDGELMAAEFNTRSGIARTNAEVSVGLSTDVSRSAASKRQMCLEVNENRHLDEEYSTFSRRNQSKLTEKQRLFNNQKVVDDDVADVDIDRYFNFHQRLEENNNVKLTKTFNCPSCTTKNTSFPMLPLCFCGQRHDEILKGKKALQKGITKNMVMMKHILPHSCGEPCNRFLSESHHYYGNSTPFDLLELKSVELSNGKKNANMNKNTITLTDLYQLYMTLSQKGNAQEDHITQPVSHALLPPRYKCTHYCSLLCHPGPHPKCSSVISTTVFVDPVTQRETNQLQQITCACGEPQTIHCTQTHLSTQLLLLELLSTYVTKQRNGPNLLIIPPHVMSYIQNSAYYLQNPKISRSFRPSITCGKICGKKLAGSSDTDNNNKYADICENHSYINEFHDMMHENGDEMIDFDELEKSRYHYIKAQVGMLLGNASSVAYNYSQRFDRLKTTYSGSKNDANNHDVFKQMVLNLHDIYALYQAILRSYLGGSADDVLDHYKSQVNSMISRSVEKGESVEKYQKDIALLDFLTFDYNGLYNVMLECPHHCEKPCHFGDCPECTYEIRATPLNSAPKIIEVSDYYSEDENAVDDDQCGEIPPPKMKIEEVYEYNCFCSRCSTSSLPCGKTSRKKPNKYQITPQKLENDKILSYSCGSTCDCYLPCGHQCTYDCHNGDCAPCVYCNTVGITVCSCTQTCIITPSQHLSGSVFVDYVSAQSKQHLNSFVLQQTLLVDLSTLNKNSTMRIELLTNQQLTQYNAQLAALSLSPTQHPFPTCSTSCNGLHLINTQSSLILETGDTRDIFEVSLQSSQYQCQHSCPQTCHVSQCLPCLGAIDRPCRCGRGAIEIECFLTSLTHDAEYLHYLTYLSSWQASVENREITFLDYENKPFPSLPLVPSELSTGFCADSYVCLSSQGEENDIIYIHPQYMTKYRHLLHFLQHAQKGTTGRIPPPPVDIREKAKEVEKQKEQLHTPWPLFGEGWFITSATKVFKRGDLAYALSTNWAITGENNVEWRDTSDDTKEMKLIQQEKLQQQRRAEMERLLHGDNAPPSSTPSSPQGTSIDSIENDEHFHHDNPLQKDDVGIDSNLQLLVNQQQDKSIVSVVFRGQTFPQRFFSRQTLTKHMYLYVYLPSPRAGVGALSLQLQPLCVKLCKQKLSCNHHLCLQYCCNIMGQHYCSQRCQNRLRCGHSHEASCHSGACGGCHEPLRAPVSCECGKITNADPQYRSVKKTNYGNIVCSDNEYTRINAACQVSQCVRGADTNRLAQYLQLNGQHLLKLFLKHKNFMTANKQQNTTTISTTTTSATTDTALIELTTQIDCNPNPYHSSPIYTAIMDGIRSFVPPPLAKKPRGGKRSDVPQPEVITPVTHTTLPNGQLIVALKLRYIHTLVIRDDSGNYVNMLEYCEGMQQKWQQLLLPNVNNTLPLIPTNITEQTSENQAILDDTAIKPRNKRFNRGTKQERPQDRVNPLVSNAAELILPLSIFEAAWFPPGNAFSFLNTSYIESYLPTSQYKAVVRASNSKAQREQRDQRHMLDIRPEEAAKSGPLRNQYRHLYFPTPSSATGKLIDQYYNTIQNGDDLRNHYKELFPYGLYSGQSGAFIGTIRAMPSQYYIEHTLTKLQLDYVEAVEKYNAGGFEDIKDLEGSEYELLFQQDDIKSLLTAYYDNHYQIQPVTLYSTFTPTTLGVQNALQQSSTDNQVKVMKNSWTGQTVVTNSAMNRSMFLSAQHQTILKQHTSYCINLVMSPFTCTHSCGQKCHSDGCYPCSISVVPSCAKHNNPTNYLSCYSIQADYYTNGSIRVPVCNQRCEATLPCHDHTCQRLCHDGPCLIIQPHFASVEMKNVTKNAGSQFGVVAVGSQDNYDYLIKHYLSHKQQQQITNNHLFNKNYIISLLTSSIKQETYLFNTSYLSPMFYNTYNSQHQQTKPNTNVLSLFSPFTPISNIAQLSSQLRPLVIPNPSVFGISNNGVQTSSATATKVVLSQQYQLYIFALRVVRELLMNTTIPLFVPLERFVYTPQSTLLPYSCISTSNRNDPTTCDLTSSDGSSDFVTASKLASAHTTTLMSTNSLHFTSTPSAFVFIHHETLAPALYCSLPELIDVIIALFDSLLQQDTTKNAHSSTKRVQESFVSPPGAAYILNMYLSAVVHMLSTSLTTQHAPITSTRPFSLYNTIIKNGCRHKCGNDTHELKQNNIYHNKEKCGMIEHRCKMRCHNDEIVLSLFTKLGFSKTALIAPSHPLTAGRNIIVTNNTTDSEENDENKALLAQVIDMDSLSSPITAYNLDHLPKFLRDTKKYINIPISALTVQYQRNPVEKVLTSDLLLDRDTTYPTLFLNVERHEVEIVDSQYHPSHVPETTVDKNGNIINFVGEFNDIEVVPDDGLPFPSNNDEVSVGDSPKVDLLDTREHDTVDYVQIDVETPSTEQSPAQQFLPPQDKTTEEAHQYHVGDEENMEVSVPNKYIPKIKTITTPQTVTLTNRILVQYSSYDQLFALSALLNLTPSFFDSSTRKKQLLRIFDGQINCLCAHHNQYNDNEDDKAYYHHNEKIVYGNEVAILKGFNEANMDEEIVLPTICIHQYHRLSTLFSQLQTTMLSVDVDANTIDIGHNISEYIQSFLPQAENTSNHNISVQNILYSKNLTSKVLSNALILTTLSPVNAEPIWTPKTAQASTQFTLVLSLPLLFKYSMNSATTMKDTTPLIALENANIALFTQHITHNPTTAFLRTHGDALSLALSTIYAMQKYYNPIAPPIHATPSQQLYAQQCHDESVWHYTRYDNIHDPTCQSVTNNIVANHSSALNANVGGVMHNISLFPFFFTAAPADAPRLYAERQPEKYLNYLIDRSLKPPMASFNPCSLFPCQHDINVSCECANDTYTQTCAASLASSLSLLQHALLLSLFISTPSSTIVTAGVNPNNNSFEVITEPRIFHEKYTKIQPHPFILPQLSKLLQEDPPPLAFRFPSYLSPSFKSPSYPPHHPNPTEFSQAMSLHFALSPQITLPRLQTQCVSYTCQRQRKIHSVARILNVPRADEYGQATVRKYVAGAKSFIVDAFTTPLWDANYQIYQGGRLSPKTTLVFPINSDDDRILTSYFSVYRGGLVLDKKMSMDTDYEIGSVEQLVERQSLSNDGIITPFSPTFIVALSQNYPEAHVIVCEGYLAQFLTASRENTPYFVTPPLNAKYRKCMYALCEVYRVSAKSFSKEEDPRDVAEGRVKPAALVAAGTTLLAVDKQMVLMRTPLTTTPLYSVAQSIQLYKNTQQFICCCVDSYGAIIDNRDYLKKTATILRHKHAEQMKQEQLIKDREEEKNMLKLFNQRQQNINAHAAYQAAQSQTAVKSIMYNDTNDHEALASSAPIPAPSLLDVGLDPNALPSVIDPSSAESPQQTIEDEVLDCWDE